MDERIEAFLLDVLADEGKHFNVVRANTRCYLALYVEMFRARELDDYRKDVAACKSLINAKALRPQVICGSF
jgi:hypothetical protein